MSEGRFEFFPYREEDVFRRGDETFPILRPTIDLQLERGEDRTRVSVLIDTGAPFTLMARGVGDALGIDFDRSKARRAEHVIGGGFYTAQLELVHLTIPAFPSITWETEVGFFVQEWKLPFGGVLGHQGFLDRWAVSFNYSSNVFVIEDPQLFHDRMPPDYNRVYEERDLGWH